MKSFISASILFLFTIFSNCYAAESLTQTALAPQPTTCVQGVFSSTGDAYWRNITLKITNNCNKTIDFRDGIFTFKNKNNLNTNFWGEFTPLSYPEQPLSITSQKQTDGTYLSTFNLHFGSAAGVVTQLPATKFILIKYGAPTSAFIANSFIAYLGGQVSGGNIVLSNKTAKPADVTQNYALVHVTLNSLKIADVQVPWLGSQTVANLADGSYNISPENISISGKVYNGNANPATVTITSASTVTSNITYSSTVQTGKINLGLQPLPTALNGYTGKPVVTLSGGGSSTSATLNWNSSFQVTPLQKGTSYNFTTPTINYNSVICQPVFNPTSAIADDTTVPTVALTYNCGTAPTIQSILKVNGAPSTLTSLQVTLTPSDTTGTVTQTVPLTNGSGSQQVALMNNSIYQVRADSVSGYSVAFNPQPFKAAAQAIETITLTSSSSGNTPVSINGQLHVCGTQLCNQAGQPIQLKGMSTHGLQWYGWNVCITPASLDALASNWKSSVIRLSLYVQEDGYETDPVGFTNQMNTLIAEATKRGIYVIVDWHMLDPGDPNYNLTRAKKFFTDVINANKGKVNLLYEIANEPNGVTWATIKSYADQLIPVIRALDPNAVIIVGTPAWSSLGISDGKTSQDIISNKLNYPNIMYTFHFYAASHKAEYLNELDKASNSLPIFVTEWGTQTYSGDGADDFVQSDKYIELMTRKKIGWTSWNYSDDFRSGASWKVGTCAKGQWVDSNLKPAGAYIKSKILP